MKKVTLSKFIHGSRYEVEDKYDELLREDIEVISTTITQDFSKFQNVEKFILVVTYKQKIKEL